MDKNNFTNFLSPEGQEIYDTILEHLKTTGIDNLIDAYELTMLANSFDLYSKNAKICKDKSATQKPDKGGWDQIRPEYTVMKNEYQNILKHSQKFGLNPESRAKIFKGMLKKKKSDPSEGLD